MRCALISLFAIGCATAPPAPPVKPAEPAKPAEPSEPVGMPKGYAEVRADRVVPYDNQGALLLVDESDNRVLPVFIGGTEEAAIDGRLRGATPIRPLTHDLLDHVMQRLHASLVQVQVDELRDQIFIGSIFVRTNGRVVRIDARPSDACALAVGNHVPIYVARSVLDQAGLPWDEVQRQLAGQPTPAS